MMRGIPEPKTSFSSPCVRVGLLSSPRFVILSSRRISRHNTRYWQEMLREAQQDSEIVDHDKVAIRNDKSNKRTKIENLIVLLCKGELEGVVYFKF